MTVFLVAYDLNDEVRRPKITKEIDQTPYAMLSESSYAIDTDEDEDGIYRRFSKYLDENDTFYVIKLTKPVAGQGPDEVNEWLQERLPW